MAILGFKNEAVLTTEVNKLLGSLVAFGATAGGLDMTTTQALWTAVGTQVATTIVGFIPMKGKNPFGAREKVYSEETHESEVDSQRREVRRETVFVTPDEDSSHIFVGAYEPDDSSVVSGGPL